MPDQKLEKNVSLTIPFVSAECAILACEVLNVDIELKGSGVTRKVTTSDTNLLINLCGQDLKRLRVSANAVLKNIILIAKTMELYEKVK